MEETIPPIKTLDEIIRAVAERVRSLRISRNLSQEDAAKKAGISLRTLRRLENKGLSTLETLLRVLRALDVADPLSSLVPKPQISPMALLHASTDQPRRVRRRGA